MKRLHISLLLSILFAVSSVLPASAQQVHPQSRAAQKRGASFSEQAHRITLATNGGLKLLRLNTYGAPSSLIGTESAAPLIAKNSASTDVENVRTAVNSFANTTLAPALGLSHTARLHEVSTDLFDNAWMSFYQVQYHGVPLRDHRVIVHTGQITGSVMIIRSNVSQNEPNIIEPVIEGGQAILVASDSYIAQYGKAGELAVEPHLVYIDNPANETLRLAYDLILTDGFHRWRYSIDAENGAILDRRDMIVCNHGKEFGSPDDAEAFKHSFTVHSSDDMIEEVNEEAPANGGGNASRIAEAVSGKITAMVHPSLPTDPMVEVPLAHVRVTVNSSAGNKTVFTDTAGIWRTDAEYPITVSAKLEGTYQVVLNQGGNNASVSKVVQSGQSLDILFDQSNSDSAERDAFYAVEFARSNIRKVDTKATDLNKKLIVNVNVNQSCNAFYNADKQNPALSFFHRTSQCANTAAIASVVAHEYGHRVNHVRSVNHMVDQALDEGLADVVGNLLYDDPVIGRRFFNNNNVLRNSDNTRQWPDDISPDAHETGCIVSGAIWDLREAIGLDAAQQIYIKAMYLRPDGIGYNSPGAVRDALLEVLDVMLVSDDDNNNLADGSLNQAAILKAFMDHNIGIQNYFDMEVNVITDGTGLDQSYPVTAKVVYNGAAGVIDPSSVKAYYVVGSKGTAYQSVQLHATGNPGEFVGAIPKVDQNKIVKYYIGAKTTYADAGEAIYPLYKDEPFRFLVGYDRKVYDDLEATLTGWQLFDDNDPTSNGFWTHGEPIGTYKTPNIFIQQDTDRTVNGMKCIVTGNKSTTNILADVVTGGNTTLTSPAFNVSTYTDPVVRYWYYFSNTEGGNSGTPVWKTQFSSDNGSSWKTLQAATNLATKGWQPFVWRVKDNISTLPSQLKLRFIATDFVAAQSYPEREPQTGTLVEAGIDDIEILDFATLSVGKYSESSGDIMIHPNPIHAGALLSFSVQSESEMIHSAELLDQLGRSVQMTTLPAGTLGASAIVIPTKLSAGVYYLLVQSSQKQYLTKVVVW